MYAVKIFSQPKVLNSTHEFTLVKNLILADFVTKNSQLSIFLSSMKEVTQEKDHTLATYVIKHFYKAPILNFTKVSIEMINLSLVQIVPKPLYSTMS